MFNRCSIISRHISGLPAQIFLTESTLAPTSNPGIINRSLSQASSGMSASSVEVPDDHENRLGLLGYYYSRFMRLLAVGLIIVRADSFQDFQPRRICAPASPTLYTDRRTDMQLQYRALHYNASRGKKHRAVSLQEEIMSDILRLLP